MYKVIEHFTDLHDKNHPYQVGDIFPREGVDVSEKRLAELAGKDNKRGVPLIEAEETVQPDSDPGDETTTPEEPKTKRGTKTK